MREITIAVLGAGHGGRAVAAFLGAVGYDVNLYNRTPENIAITKQQRGIYLTYAPELEDGLFANNIDRVEVESKHEYSLTHRERRIETDLKQAFGRLNKVSSNIQEVIEGRELLMVTVPATGHRFIANQCAPYLQDGQTVILNPGRCFGAIEFYKIIYDYYKEKGKNPPDINMAEAQSFVYTARRLKPRSVRIFGVKNSVDIAALPSHKIKEVINVVGDIYPQFTPEKNVLKTSLGNLGGVFHVPTTVLNANKIYRKEDFEYYRDGVTEHTAAIIEDVDKERLAIAKAMDVDVVSARWWLYLTYGSEGSDLYESVQNTHAYMGIEGPESVNHRYIWEDVPTSLVPLSSLGKKVGVPTPLIDSFIHQATSLLRKDLNMDFFQRGRTLERLGLADKSVDQIKEFIETGTL